MKELAGDGVPVTVTCRVMKLPRQPYYRWLDKLVTDAVLEEAHRANALFDAHHDDPEFGCRFLADEARGVGALMADRTAWRICRDNRWWSVFGKKRGRGSKAGPPVHDDLVSHEFTATGPNRLWLADITDPARSSGWKTPAEVFQEQLRSLQQPGVATTGWTRPIPVTDIRPYAGPPPDGRLDRESRGGRRQRGHGVLLQPAAEERPRPPELDQPRRSADRDRDLDREGLPPTLPTHSAG